MPTSLKLRLFVPLTVLHQTRRGDGAMRAILDQTKRGGHYANPAVSWPAMTVTYSKSAYRFTTTVGVQLPYTIQNNDNNNNNNNNKCYLYR